MGILSGGMGQVFGWAVTNPASQMSSCGRTGQIGLTIIGFQGNLAEARTSCASVSQHTYSLTACSTIPVQGNSSVCAQQTHHCPTTFNSSADKTSSTRPKSLGVVPRPSGQSMEPFCSASCSISSSRGACVLPPSNREHPAAAASAQLSLQSWEEEGTTYQFRSLTFC